MPYEARIQRANPSCFVFLLDRSLSMTEVIPDEQTKTKMQIVADALNRLLRVLAMRCTREKGVRDYFNVAVIGYGNNRAESILGGPLTGQELVPISQIEANPLRIEKRMQKQYDGAGANVELEKAFPVWVDPDGKGNTPMCLALSKARDLVGTWVSLHPRSYPPITLNLTDGEGNDGDPVPYADQLRSLSTEDGNALLFNLHISPVMNTPITYPDSDAGLPDAFARNLFTMSSILPPTARKLAQSKGYRVAENSRGFVYNADIVSIIDFLEIGSGFELLQLER